MTKEEIAVGLAQDPEFKRLAPDRQYAVFEDAVQRATKEQSSPSLMQGLGALRIAPLGPPLSDYPSLAANAMNAAGAGIPGFLYNRLMGQQVPQPQSFPGKMLNVVGEGAGMMVGLPGAAGAGAAALLPKALAGRAVARGVEGAVVGATANLPTTITNPRQGAINAGLGAAGNVVIPPLVRKAVEGFQFVNRLRNPELRAQMVNSIRQSFLQSKKLTGERFGARLDALANRHPEQRVDLSEAMREYQQRAQANPAFQSLIGRSVRNDQESAMLQSILNQPETASNLTMREAQSVKQIFGRALKQKFGQVSPDLLDAHLDANDLYHSIRSSQLNAFPEFRDIAADYSKSIQDFRTVKPYLKPASLEPSLLNNFGNKSEIQAAVHRLLPKETVKEIERFVTTIHRMRLGGEAARKIGFGALFGTGAGVAHTLYRASRRD